MTITLQLTPEDVKALGVAYRQLEHPSMAARLTHFVGLPIERSLKLLPKTWHGNLRQGISRTLLTALESIISPLDDQPGIAAQERYHKLLAATSGALGGYFGLPAVIAELPMSTIITLRAIADIARSEGEDVSDLHTRLACLEVLALGGRTEEDNAAETGYYGLRIALALHLSKIPEKALEKGILKPSHPTIVVLLAAIAARFGVVVTDKVAAQMVPILGALSGALVNIIFMQHFQDIARAHFTVRRLERKYGPDLVRREYDIFSRAERK
ncbi:EcsC family protein [Nitrosomonas sp. Nm34]|uniref:EcsC family protein n=1 Tax=Nitrosomonas sp. Nm34 TaxID=1881055 RepID=UPI0008F2BDF5|nr:EcsC family protein [Nitrosomonas sp. Nm34]SFI22851.1 EcsC protein family protein [Nitrosomonas sp. Nm34]